MRTAGLRILEARAALGIAGSALYPQLQQLSGEVLRAGQQQSNGPDTAFWTYGVGLDIAWELDFWGKFRRGIESADAAYFASIAAYDDAQVLVAAQAASLYASIRTIELRLRIAHENAALQKRSLEITERLFKSGNESELDVQQARTQYLSTVASIPELEGSLRQVQNALSVLIARPPGPLPEMEAGREKIPTAELAVIVDLPAELLRRRPDVRAAEARLAAQSAQIGVSEAALYPSIALVGSVGLSATSLDWSARTLPWAVGPSLVWNIFDWGRLKNQVLVQDARFQQLYEQYQGTVLRAARELDDAAIDFAKFRSQVDILRDAVQAARRSLDIANIQYREGLVDFQRVLDSQRSLFSQQERLVSTQGGVTQSLISVYKAMGGGWQAARAEPFVDEPTRAEMSAAQQLERPARRTAATGRHRILPAPDRNAMNQETANNAAPGTGTRIGAIVIAVVILVSLLLYFVGDRLTPYTTQARIQAFVVPVAAEVAGKFSKVYIRNNDEVQPGQPLFDIDPKPYEIALQRARADYASVRSSVNASAAGVDAARASLAAAQAHRAMAESDASRQEHLYKEDPGAISVRRLESAQATREEARSKVRRAEADLRKAQEAAGEPGDNNTQVQSARAAVEKAELDLARTKVLAPARGVVTDLRTDVGHYAQPGAPVMTLIAMHDLWISADLTENNLGHIDPGDKVAIVLDILPGEVLKGRVRSIGGGVAGSSPPPPGTLPQVQNSRDWLRQAQRIPVAIEFDPAELPRLRVARIGGQAEVLVYTDDNPIMNTLGTFYIRVMSWLSYLY